MNPNVLISNSCPESNTEITACETLAVSGRGNKAQSFRGSVLTSTSQVGVESWNQQADLPVTELVGTSNPDSHPPIPPPPVATESGLKTWLQWGWRRELKVLPTVCLNNQKWIWEWILCWKRA